MDFLFIGLIFQILILAAIVGIVVFFIQSTRQISEIPNRLWTF